MGTKEPDFRELRQTIGVVRVRLIRRPHMAQSGRGGA
jgi:hypothetical protein